MSRPVDVRKADSGKLRQALSAGNNSYFSDVSVELGGEDSAPDPHDLLDSALGACTALTLTIFARRKQLPLSDVHVEITHTESGGVYKLNRRIELVGDLSEEQRQLLLGIANKCPIHKALMGKFEIESALV